MGTGNGSPGSEPPGNDSADIDSTDDDSSRALTSTRRGLLVGLTTGSGALGLGAAVQARGPGAAGNNGRVDDAAGNNDQVSRGNGPPDRHIVGTSSQAAADEAARRANEVRHVIDFGDDIGKAVAGRFPEQALEALQRRKDVRYVEADATMEAIGEAVPWGVDRVDADVAHDTGATGDGADVAILDSGIDSDHPDLVDNLGAGKAFVDCGTAYDGSSCSGNGNTCHEAWDDDNDHGTHCAGIAAAVDNAEGVLGVSKGATLHPVKVLGCSGRGYLSDIAAGIEHTANQGWDVASMSLGSSSDSSTMRDACQYAVDNGVLVVAAAGNDGPCTDCVSYPAAYDTVVAVSATTSSDDLASYSSTGPEIDVAAPGSSVLSTIPGGTAYFSGTSMACPHVSGAGGLLMANGASNAEVRTALQDTAEDIGLSSSDSGNGLLDAEAASGSVELDLPSIDATAAGSASLSGSGGSYTITAAGTDVWKSADEYGAIYHDDVSGDVIARTTVKSQENTHQWAKSGIIIANDITAPGSSSGDVTLAVTPENGIAFQWDSDGDGYVDDNTTAGTTSYPCELRLTKLGTEIVGEHSVDGGSTWTQVGSATVQEAGDTQDVGVFTTAHRSSTECTTEFANFGLGSPSVDLASVDTTPSSSAAFSGSGGDYTITASGTDVWKAADEYGALYHDDVSGDVLARTTIKSQENTHKWAKSGIMIANDLTASGSSVGDVVVSVTPENGFAFQWDSDGDGFVAKNTNAGTTAYPCELRVTKSGSTFTGEYSTDGGSTWTTIDAATIQDTADVQDVGVFTTAHDDTANCTTEFANFELGDPASGLSSVDTTAAGNASFSGNSGDYTIDASGDDVWRSSDQYGARYQSTVSGDVIARTTVESQENTHKWAKSGIMIANDITTGGSSAGDVLVAVTPENGFAFQWDSDGDGFVDNNTNTGTTAFPCELRVTKSGSEFVGEYSTDGGSTWTTIDTVTVQDANSAQDVGVFTTSHNGGTKCTASFTGFSLS